MIEHEAPVWLQYVGDLFFLIAFLVVLFFFKPGTEYPAEDMNEDEQPDLLEQVLRSDGSDTRNDNDKEVV